MKGEREKSTTALRCLRKMEGDQISCLPYLRVGHAALKNRITDLKMGQNEKSSVCVVLDFIVFPLAQFIARTTGDEVFRL